MITIQFTLGVTGISAPVPPTTPTLELAPYDVTGAPGYTNIATPNLIGVTTPGATVELLQANGQPFSPVVITTSDPVTGTFTLTFPNPTNQQGLITVEADASNSNGTSGDGSTSFTIILTKPTAPGTSVSTRATTRGSRAMTSLQLGSLTSSAPPHRGRPSNCSR